MKKLILLSVVVCMVTIGKAQVADTVTFKIGDFNIGNNISWSSHTMETRIIDNTGETVAMKDSVWHVYNDTAAIEALIKINNKYYEMWLEQDATMDKLKKMIQVMYDKIEIVVEDQYKPM